MLQDVQPICEDMIFINTSLTRKSEALDTLVNQAIKVGLISDSKEFLEAVYKREEEASTAVGFNVAIPHGKAETVKKPFIGFIQIKDSFYWNEDDAESVQLIFLIGVPSKNEGNIHLKFISQLSRKLINNDFRKSLLKATSKKEAFELLSEINKEL